MMPALPVSLVATRISCIKGDRLLFKDLSLSLAAGQGIELTGPNGVGKTSLLRILAGLARPDAGDVKITLPDSMDEPAIEFLTIKDGLKAALTPTEHIQFWARFGGHARSQAANLLAEVGLEAQAQLPVFALSSGQKRRLVLARAMLQKRPVLLMDEPLNALDSAGQDLLKQFVERRLAEGAIVVVATHQSLGLSALKPLRLGQEMAA